LRNIHGDIVHDITKMNKRRARNNLDNKKRKEKLTEAKRDLTCSDTILEHDTHG